MIGDRPDKDVIGAKQMGFFSCFARYGNPDVAKGASGADHEAEKPEDILKVVDTLNSSQL